MALKLITFLALATMLSFDAMAQCNDPFTLTYSPPVVCSGRDLQLNATSYPGATYTWTGPAGSGFSGVHPNNPVITNPGIMHSGTYSVSMVYNGCTYTTSTNVLVNTTPTVNLLTYKTPICPGEDEVMSAANFNGGIFHWSGPDFNFTSGLTNIAVVPNIQEKDEGWYQIYIESLDGCFSDTMKYFIEVHPKVEAGFSITSIPGCEQDSIQLNNLSTGATAGYAWTFGDGGSSTAFDPLHIYANQGSYTVTLIASNAFCKDTIQQVVSFNHSITAGFTVSDDSICQNNTINFTNTTAYQPAILPVYRWDFGDGGTDFVINPAHLFALSGVFDVKLVATDYIGCKDSAFHTIVVDSNGSISFIPSVKEICAGNTMSFKGTYMEQGLIGAQWDMKDGRLIDNQTEIEYTYDKAGTYNVTFTAFYRLCPTVSYSENILIKPYPQVYLGPDTSICPNGKPVWIQDFVNNGNPNAKWQWHTEMQEKTSGIMVRHAGDYAVTVDLDGCSASDTVVVKTDCYIRIPNAFSPNGDGKDDYFLPRELLSKGVSKFDMTIFNRWGQKVFQTSSTTGRGWDGRFNGEAQPLGVYVYLINVQFINGGEEKYQGNLTLLR